MKTLAHRVIMPKRPDPQNVMRLDMSVLPILSSMEISGMRSDKQHRVTLHATLTDEMAELQSQVSSMTGYDINIASGDQLADLLFGKLKLRQAGKEKMTRSKARLAADSDVLKGMISQHPVMQVILDWKEREKLRSTYTYSLIRKADENDRVHPDLNHTGPETGRLSCSLLQTIPTRTLLGKSIRQGFIPEPGNVLGTVDACLHPDTLVKTVYGPKRIADIRVGESVLTYRDKKIQHGKVVKQSTIQPKEAYRITFDNGESVIASYDHRWPTLTYPAPGRKAGMVVKMTEDLSVGTRMVPCREGHMGNGRRTWYSWSSFLYTPQHVLVAEAVYGPRPEGCDVHHIDEDYLNNYPTNLEYKPSSKHKSDHSIENYKTQDHSYRIERLREGLKCRRKYDGTANPNSKLTDSQHTSIRELALKGRSASAISREFNLSYGYARALVVKALKGRNHRITAIEYVGIQPMHAITVDPDHNYVLECGVVTMNSQIEMRCQAYDSNALHMMDIFWDWSDLYWGTAEGMYKRTFSPEDRKHGVEPVTGQSFKQYYRNSAKIVTLGVSYDISAEGLLDQFLVWKAIEFLTDGNSMWDYDKYYRSGLANCVEAIKAFYNTYPELLDARKRHHRRAVKYGMVWDDFGRIRWIPQVYSTHRWIVSEGNRAAGNMPIQGLAAGIVKLWMAVIWDRVRDYWWKYGIRPLIAVHDEVLSEGPKSVMEDFLPECSQILRNLIPYSLLNVPLESNSAIGNNWAELEK